MYGQPPTSEGHTRRSRERAESERAVLERTALDRATEAAMLGLGPRLDRNATRDLVARVESDPDARVRIAALGALARCAPKVSARAAWKRAIVDRDPAVRRRAAELAPLLD